MFVEVVNDVTRRGSKGGIEHGWITVLVGWNENLLEHVDASVKWARVEENSAAVVHVLLRALKASFNYMCETAPFGSSLDIATQSYLHVLKRVPSGAS